MVASLLNPKVSYPELKRVDAADMGRESELFEIEMHDLPVLVAVGAAKNTFIDSGLLYYPLYLVKHNNKVIQVGVIEIAAQSTLDSTRVTPESLLLENDPLLYTFATTEFITKLRKVPPPEPKPEPEAAAEEEEEEEEEEVEIVHVEKKPRKSKEAAASAVATDYTHIPHVRSDLFKLVQGAKVPLPLQPESRKDARNIHKKYHEREDDMWIQKFMKNRNYHILDNEGSGDCFFATIRDAFRTIGQETTAAKLRERIADDLTPEVYKSYKERYDMFKSELDRLKAESSKLNHENKKLIQEYEKNIFDANKRAAIKSAQTNVLAQYNKLKDEHAVVKQLMEDVKFMKDINDMNAFREYVKKSDFWADAWAISALERILNIKLILLSSERYQEGDLDHVLQCATDFSGPDASNRDHPYVPEFYVILEYTGDHYRLITYKDHALFKFKELPYDLKEMVAHKCLERNGGLFMRIPDWDAFETEREAAAGEQTGGASASRRAQAAGIDFDLDELNDAKLLNLYDDAVVLSISPRASGVPLPGRGTSERHQLSRMLEYAALAKHKDWRRRLDNSWIQPFHLDGHQWGSVAHYVHAVPFRERHPEFYLMFTYESGSDLSKCADHARAAASNKGKWRGRLVRPAEVKVDVKTAMTRDQLEAVLGEALAAKFTQHEDLRRMLLDTRNAKLVEHRRGAPPAVSNALMVVREGLARGDMASRGM